MFEPKVYDTQREKRVDFVIGLAGWFVINALLALMAWGAATALNAAYETGTVDADLVTAMALICGGVLPILINIGGMVYFAITRKWIALGVLTGFGVAVCLALGAGVVFLVWCFSGLGPG